MSNLFSDPQNSRLQLVIIKFIFEKKMSLFIKQYDNYKV